MYSGTRRVIDLCGAHLQRVFEIKLPTCLNKCVYCVLFTDRSIAPNYHLQLFHDFYIVEIDGKISLR